jgi:hypothetical protein
MVPRIVMPGRAEGAGSSVAAVGVQPAFSKPPASAPISCLVLPAPCRSYLGSYRARLVPFGIHLLWQRQRQAQAQTDQRQAGGLQVAVKWNTTGEWRALV